MLIHYHKAISTCTTQTTSFYAWWLACTKTCLCINTGLVSVDQTMEGYNWKLFVKTFSRFSSIFTSWMRMNPVMSANKKTSHDMPWLESSGFPCSFVFPSTNSIYIFLTSSSPSISFLILFFFFSTLFHFQLYYIVYWWATGIWVMLHNVCDCGQHKKREVIVSQVVMAIHIHTHIHTNTHVHTHMVYTRDKYQVIHLPKSEQNLFANCSCKSKCNSIQHHLQSLPKGDNSTENNKTTNTFN